MVHLADERKAVFGHPLGKVKLPERTAAVQRCARDLTDDLVEFAPTTGVRHRYPTQVVIQVNLAVLQPNRMMQPIRDVDQLVAQRIQQM
jgi:hypothetical protein